MPAELSYLLTQHGSLLVVGAVVVICFVAAEWRRVRLTEAELTFKAELLARGLSVEEVERLAARQRPTLLEQFRALSGGAKAGLIFLGIVVATMLMNAVAISAFAPDHGRF